MELKDYAELVDKQVRWNYFLGLDRQLKDSRTYCAVDKKNSLAFSDEYAKMILLASVHFEEMAKLYIKSNVIEGKCGSIGEIKGAILSVRPNIVDMTFIVPASDTFIFPLITWKDNGKLPWWEAFVALKHNYVSAKEQASQIHALCSIGACYVMHLYYLEKYPQKQTVMLEDPRNFFYQRPTRLLLGQHGKLP